MNNEAYNSREEAIEFGKDYEYLMSAYYSLIFAVNDGIQDFKISTNNKDLGDFDDVVLEVDISNEEKYVFALQLKHKLKPIPLMFLINNKKFSLKKYEEEFSKIKKKYPKLGFEAPFENFHCILFSNSSLEGWEDICENWTKLRAATKAKTVESDVFIRRKVKFPAELLSVADNENSENVLFDFCSVKTNLFGEQMESESMFEWNRDEDFFTNFSFYTKQQNAKEIESTIINKISEMFPHCPNVARNYINFFRFWCRRDYGTVKLTKQDVKMKLAELVLSQYIPEPDLSKLDGCSEEKSQALFELMTAFHVTIIDSYSKSILDNIWNAALWPLRSLSIGLEWLVPIKGIDVNFLMKTHVPSIAALSENFSELTLKKDYIFFWHLDKVALVVKVDDNKHNRENVLKAMSMCSPKCFILIDKNDSFQSSSLKCLRYLSDADKIYKGQDFYTNILRNLSVSVQGRKCITLEQFIAINESFLNVLSVANLALLNNSAIGRDCTKTMKMFTAIRKIPKIVFYADVLNFIKDDVILVSFQNQQDNDIAKKGINIETYLFLKDRALRDLTDIFPETNFIVSETGQDFEKLSSVNPTRNCHHFRFVSDEKLEWVETKGAIDKLHPFRLNVNKLTEEDFLNEDKLVAHHHNVVNLICASAGMGKSILLQQIMFYCPPDYWVVLIDLHKHSRFFANKHTLDELIQYLTQVETTNELSTQIMSLYVKQKKLLICWDGLDEMSKEVSESVIANIKTMSSFGCVNWLAARSNLQQVLENEFNSFALMLPELDESTRMSFIYAMLKNKNFELKNRDEEAEMVATIDNHISRTLECGQMDCSGIPIQIEIITETYFGCKEREFRCLVDAYQDFIDNRFDILFKKANATEDNYFMQQMCDDYKHSQLALYETAAMQALFNLDLDCNELLLEVQTDGDPLGLISGVAPNGNPIFAQKTYAEFLAARWLTKHQENSSLIQCLFQDKYTNVRLMFDMLLAKESPIHLAVLYRDHDYIRLNKEKISCVDLSGRSPLHLACSWGTPFPIIKPMEDPNEIVYGDENRALHNFKHMFDKFNPKIANLKETEEFGNAFIEMYKKTFDMRIDPSAVYINSETILWTEEEDSYVKILDELLEKCDVFSKDRLLGWDAINYLEKSLSLAALNAILRKHHVELTQLNEYNDTITLTHYAVFRSFDNLFKLIPAIPYMEYKFQSGLSTLLQFACEFNNTTAVKELLQYECYKNAITAISPFSSDVLSSAAAMSDSEMIDVLLSNGAKVNGIAAPPLLTATLRESKEICLKLLDAGADVNKQVNGLSPLTLSIISQNVDLIKIFLENGPKINDMVGCYTPLMFGLKNLEIVQLLLQHGADPNKACGTDLGYTSLHMASEFGDVEVVKILLKHGADPAIKSKTMLTPLQVAIINSREQAALELISADPSVVDENASEELLLPIIQATVRQLYRVVEALAKHGADVNCSKLADVSPLHMAALKNDDACVSVLLKHGACPNRVVDGDFPLMLAVKHLSTTEILLNNGANVNARTELGLTALHFAAQDGNVDVIKALLKRGFDLNAKTTKGKTPLHYSIVGKNIENARFLLDKNAELSEDFLSLAASFDLPDFIELLLQKGINVNSIDPNGNTALVSAVFQGNINCIELLLKHGANPNLKSKEVSPLLFAILGRHFNAVQVLLNAGASVEEGFKTFTPIMWAAALKDVLSVITLNDKGASVNHSCDEGMTPLHYLLADNNQLPPDVEQMLKPYKDLGDCIRYDKKYCVEELLARGALINQRTNKGVTPLHAAVSTSGPDLVSLLLRNGAEVNAADINGKSPLHWCYITGRMENKDVLLASGADLSLEDNFNKTPLDYAAIKLRDLDLSLGSPIERVEKLNG